jgi:hypothetical protein
MKISETSLKEQIFSFWAFKRRIPTGQGHRNLFNDIIEGSFPNLGKTWTTMYKTLNRYD